MAVAVAVVAVASGPQKSETQNFGRNSWWRKLVFEKKCSDLAKLISGEWKSQFGAPGRPFYLVNDDAGQKWPQSALI